MGRLSWIPACAARVCQRRSWRPWRRQPPRACSRALLTGALDWAVTVALHAAAWLTGMGSAMDDTPACTALRAAFRPLPLDALRKMGVPF